MYLGQYHLYGKNHRIKWTKRKGQIKRNYSTTKLISNYKPCLAIQKLNKTKNELKQNKYHFYGKMIESGILIKG